MTCSKDFGRLLQAACLGLIGTLAFAGCGGSETKKTDSSVGGIDGSVTPPGTASLNASPPALNLGNIDQKTGGVGTITVTNTGKATSGAIAVTASAGIAASGCSAALVAGGSCGITVVVTPTAVGTFSGNVTITANPGASPTPLVVSVVAVVTSQGGPFSVAPGTIDLGNIPVGVAAPRQSLTVTANIALSDLAVAASGADVKIDPAATTCTAVLAANASCTIAVNFLATTSGEKSDSIAVSGGGANGTVIRVPIRALAQAPAKLAISPASALFAAPVGSVSSTITFGIINLGDLPTSTVVVDVTGTNKTSFVQTNNCLALASLATCTVSVVYKPAAATATTETATLTATDSGAGASTVSATLTGTPVGPSLLTITSATTDLGTVLVGATGAPVVFTVTNTGDTASGALTVSLSNPEFIITNDTCSATSLPPKTGTCTLSIALRPTSAGVSKSATLTVAGSGGNPAVKTITGTGNTNASLSATPSTLDFKTVRVNKTAADQTVTVKNLGGSATGPLTFGKTGEFDVFPITSNGCSAALPPLGTCTFTVGFTPTAAKAWGAAYTITDGQSSATVSVTGTGLPQSGVSISPSPVGACAEPNPQPADAVTSTQCFPATVVGGTSLPTPAITDDAGVTTPVVGSTIVFVVTADNPLPSGVADTGALTVAIAPAAPADFTIVTNGCTTALLAGASCQVVVSFTPTAAGLRQASLTVTTANGGSDSATLQGLGLALLEVRPLSTTDPDTSKPRTGLDFGQVSVLGDDDSRRIFLLIVRGPNSEATHTSQVLATLADAAQPADFMYPTDMYPQGVSPCNTSSNQAVTLDFQPTDTAKRVVGGQPNAWYWNSAMKIFTCEFTVRFYPQSTKGNKTATLSATGSGSATDSKALTGVATGALTFKPNDPSFEKTFQVGESSNTQTVASVVSLSGDDVTVTLENHSNTTDYGPVSLTLGGTNPDQFVIVRDTCTTVTLIHKDEVDYRCFVGLAFVPTSAGQKSAVLTANAGAETASVTLNAGAIDAFDITIAPDQFVLANANVHSFGTVPQTSNTAWAAFTIANPAGAPSSAQVEFGVGGQGPDGTYSSGAFVAADGNNHDFGTCGGSGTTTLDAGKSCYFWVQFKPGSKNDVDPNNALTGWIYATDLAKDKTVYVKGSGKVSSVVSIAPATYTFPDTAGGSTSASVSLTVTNNGTSTITLGIPANDAELAPFNVDQDTGCAGGAQTLAAGATCPLVVTFIGKSGISQSVTSGPTKLTVTAGGYAGGEATTKLTGTSVKPAKLVAVGYRNSGDEGFTAFYQTINMGGVQVGASSGAVTLVYKNVGSVATSSLSYGWAGLASNTQDAEFLVNTEDPTRCAGKTSLGAGETCTVSIVFTPSASADLGSRANKNFTVSAVTGGLAQVFKFTGTSLDPAASAWVGISGGAKAFFTYPNMTAGNTTTKPTTGFPKQIFQITNGTATSSVLTLTLSDTANFTLITSGTDAGSKPCGELAGGTLATTCTFAVGFRPDDWSATSVYRHATVTPGPAAYAGGVLGLYGRVQAPAILSITPSQASSAVDPYDFGQVVVNTDVTKSFTVTNIGETTSAAVTMMNDMDNEFSVGGACTSTLAAGASCIGNVTFSAPTGPSVGSGGRAFTGDLWAEAVDGKAISSDTVVVGADAVNNTTLTVTPASLSFTAQSVGTMSTSQLLTLKNAISSMTSGLLTIAIGDATNFSIVSDDCPLVTDPTLTDKDGLVMNTQCNVEILFKPQTLGTGTFETDVTMRATPGSLKNVHLTGVAVSAMHTSPPNTPPVVMSATACTIDSPCSIVAYLDEGAPLTAFVKTSLSGGNYRIVEDQCVATKMLGGDSCLIKVAPLFTANDPLKSGTLTVDGGSPGATATLILYSQTPPPS